MQIYDGRDNTAHVLGAFTGTSMLGLTLISTSNHIWLEFYTDPENNGEGFKLVYSSMYSPPLLLPPLSSFTAAVCGPVIQLPLLS